jgi:hypothetical protein
VLGLSAEAMGSLPLVQVRQAALHPVGETAAAAEQTSETLTYGPPDRLRIDAAGPEGRWVYLVEQGRAALFRDGEMVHSSTDRRFLYAELLLERTRFGLADRLRSMGVDLSVSSLGIHEGRPCYVLGALFPDPSRSQLWVDKETFLPYRLLLPPPPGAGPLAGSLEFRYGSWQPEASFQYPRRIDVFENGTAVREIRARSLDTAPAVAPSLFSIAAEMARSGAFRPAGLPPTPGGAIPPGTPGARSAGPEAEGAPGQGTGAPASPNPL